jgi:phage gpG-like protein
MKKAGSRAKNLTPALKKAGVLMQRSINQNFREEGRPVKWRKLSQATIRARRKGPGAGSAKILQDTGRGRMSVTTKGAFGSIYRLDAQSLVLGTNIGYMAKHQKGEDVPKRVFLLFQEQDKRQISELMLRHMKGGFA